MEKMNGHYDLGDFKTLQEQRFESLEAVLRQGFQTLADELKLMREQGHIPVSVVEKMQEQQKAVIYPVIRVLCYSLVLILLWFTGLKAALPHIFNIQ